jgi:hypothetical protein
MLKTSLPPPTSGSLAVAVAMTNVVLMFSAADTIWSLAKVGASFTSLTLTVMSWLSDSTPSEALTVTW